MPNLVDDRIEELLKEAEHRLRGSDAPALPSPVAQPIAVQPTTKKAAPREALSVRPAQSRPATNASKKVSHLVTRFYLNVVCCLSARRCIL